MCSTDLSIVSLFAHLIFISLINCPSNMFILETKAVRLRGRNNLPLAVELGSAGAGMHAT